MDSSFAGPKAQSSAGMPAPRPPPRSPRTPRRVSCGRSWRFTGSTREETPVPVQRFAESLLGGPCQRSEHFRPPRPSVFGVATYNCVITEAYRSDFGTAEGYGLHRPAAQNIQHGQPDHQSLDPGPDRFPVVAHAGILTRDGRLREGESALQLPNNTTYGMYRGLHSLRASAYVRSIEIEAHSPATGRRNCLERAARRRFRFRPASTSVLL